VTSWRLYNRINATSLRLSGVASADLSVKRVTQGLTEASGVSTSDSVITVGGTQPRQRDSVVVLTTTMWHRRGCEIHPTADPTPHV